MITAALYARVSSEKQAQENTVASQVEALKSRIIADSLPNLNEIFLMPRSEYAILKHLIQINILNHFFHIS